MEVQASNTAICRDAFAELGSPACIDDPYPFMRWLREHDPVHRGASGLFLLSRHADIYWALKATGDAFRGPAPGELARYFPRAATSLSMQLLASTLAMKEPPTHTRLRRLISRDFTMRQIDALRPCIARTVAARLDAMAPALQRGETVDLHREFALALPMLVFAELFGMPQDDIVELDTGIGTILEGLSPHASDLQLAAADAASAGVQRYFGDLIERKRATPQQDIVSMLVGAHDDDADALSDAELISMLWGMLLGGFATTAATLDHAVVAMLAHPEQLHWLQGDAAGVKAFVEEVLRCDAPAMFSSIPRIAQRDIEIGWRGDSEGLGCARADRGGQSRPGRLRRSGSLRSGAFPWHQPRHVDGRQGDAEFRPRHSLLPGRATGPGTAGREPAADSRALSHAGIGRAADP